MTNLLKNLGTVIVSVGIGIASLFGHHTTQITPTVGSSAPQFVAAQPTFLYGGGIGSTDTSIKLTALVTPNGTPIITSQLVGGPNNVFYATIEPATTKKETISCTGVTQNGDGTAVMTGCTRGLEFTTPYQASTTLALSHAGGSSVVISNSPQVYNDIVNDAVSLSRTNTITGLNIFSSTTPPQYDGNPVWTNFASTTFASLSYVNGVASSGAANASENVNGLSQLATSLQASAGTSVGSTAARLVLPSSLATSTCTVAQNQVPITGTNGKLQPACIDQTANYSFTGIVNLVPPGSVEAYASSTAPSGWFLTNGATYATTTYANLFAIIGYTFGGNGTSTFAVPDMRGRDILSYGTSGIASSSIIGAVGGASSTAITQANLPNINLNIVTQTSGTYGNNVVGSNNTGGGNSYSQPLGGSSTPANVLNPYLILNYIIKY